MLAAGCLQEVEAPPSSESREAIGAIDERYACLTSEQEQRAHRA